MQSRIVGSLSDPGQPVWKVIMIAARACRLQPAQLIFQAFKFSFPGRTPGLLEVDAINFGLASGPQHLRELHNYAWKALVLKDAILHHDSILWTDAGSDFRASPEPLSGQLEREGHLFFQGQDEDMSRKSHPGCYRALGTDIGRFAGKPHFAGGLQGYTRSGRAHSRILEPMFRCAMEKQCIAPPGSSLDNHRFDQTVLSILAYQSELAIKPATRLLAAERDQLAEDPLQQSERIVYTARGASIEYLRQLRDKQSRIRFPNAPTADA